MLRQSDILTTVGGVEQMKSYMQQVSSFVTTEEVKNSYIDTVSSERGKDHHRKAKTSYTSSHPMREGCP